MNTLAERVQYSRKRKCFTQDEISATIGISTSAVSQIESGGIITLGGEYLFKLADKLEVNARWLVTGEGAMEPENGTTRRDEMVAKVRQAAACLRAYKNADDKDKDHFLSIASDILEKF